VSASPVYYCLLRWLVKSKLAHLTFYFFHLARPQKKFAHPWSRGRKSVSHHWATTGRKAPLRNSGIGSHHCKNDLRCNSALGSYQCRSDLRNVASKQQWRIGVLLQRLQLCYVGYCPLNISSSSSSSSARQPYVGPGLPQKLLAANVSVYCFFIFRDKSRFLGGVVSPTPNPRVSWRADVFCQGCLT
jgi:hypothetical protein